MSQLIQISVKQYRLIMDEYSDPRTKDWFLIDNPINLLFIMAIYLYFVNIAGPKFMKDRKPYELKKTLLVYNFVQVLFSIFLVYEGGPTWLRDYTFGCEPVDYSNNPKALRIARACYWYYIAKITELLDTVFFILRKKNKQVTTLHVYHHTIMPFAGWMATRFLAGGHGTFTGWLNSFIHVVMYTYYLIAGLGPEYQKYVWWKTHVTKLQLIQFLLIFCHSFYVLWIDCSYPKVISLMICGESLVFIYMFGSFYYKSYMKTRNIKSQ